MYNKKHLRIYVNKQKTTQAAAMPPEIYPQKSQNRLKPFV
jgi:hypothetical protein